MCGFLVVPNFTPHDFTKVSLRGGDHLSTVSVHGYTFRHSLLSVTGAFVPQPYFNSNGNIVCVYNGEIYNHPFERSDGEVLIRLYEEHGTVFPRKLDGEFAIALYDFSRGICLFATDDFGTKPLFVNGVSCSSYRSGCGGDRIPANTIIVKRLSDEGIIYEGTVNDFDFNSQSVDSYNPWIDAFGRSIAKRGKHRCFIGLSSGYDSGAISCELQLQGLDFKAIAIAGSENKDVINERSKRLRDVLVLDGIDYSSVISHIEKSVEDEPYNLHFDSPQTSIFRDRAIIGLGKICEIGKAENRRVYISGQGSDEILSDYSLFGVQSELKGVYPNNLKEWKNFRKGCQYAYLMKEEYIAGSYGIETRYPFLDRALVQEFLNLTPELKNAHYKAPLREYLIRNNFPFEENVKRGFNP